MTTLAGLKPGAVFRLPDGRVCVYDGRPLVGDTTVCHVTGTGRRLRVPPSTPVELIDVPALARENDDLRALVADACEESRMWAAGVEAGRAEATALAEAYARVERGDLDASSGSHERVCHSERLEAVEDLAGEIRALGPARPPPRPHALEAEAARLREALRGLVAAVLNEMTARGLPHEWKSDSALGVAHAALGEDA